MKRIAIITSHPIQYNAPLFQLLAERGKIEVKVFYTWGEDSVAKFDPGFKKNITWDIPLLAGYNYTFVENTSADKGSHHFKGIINPTLVEDICEWQPTAILVYGWAFKSHLQVMRYFYKKIPILFRGDSTLLSERKGFSFKKIIKRVFLHWVYRHINYALYVGYSNYDYFIVHGVKKEQLLHAPHAIDIKRFMTPDNNYKEQAKSMLVKLGIMSTDRVVLYAGKIDDNKNVHLLCQAFHELNILNAHLVIVGNGKNENELKINYSDSPNIHFLGFQNQTVMPAIYRMADVFVLPSKSETWGLAANEAMACGCTVLMSSSCGARRDIIVEGKNGYSFRSGDIEDLKEKMHRLIINKNLDEMKNFSREYIQKFSFDQTCDVIERCLIK